MGQEWGRDRGGNGGGDSKRVADETLRGIWRRGGYLLAYGARCQRAAPGWGPWLAYHRSISPWCDLCTNHPERSATGRAQALGFPRGVPLLARHSWRWVNRSPRHA